ncbi:OstA family protein [Erythrobacter sp. SG61-1L]|uniref:LptA/OstA family protein n=1 Tax=Erythrobacter sp. SG61-1L TaxID=1603897 RepID=UPI0006C8FE6F|nr:LptA/OstA family protein [Erythrobacter sp. SG61-1L]KPL69227.1 OstA family protein [Erythrobacter sp. SG61-1L]
MDRNFSLPALLRSGSVRSALAGFAVTAAAVAGLQQPAAQALGSHNTDAPVNFSADRIELQDKQNRVVLSGNVVITQSDLKLTAGRTTVAYTDSGSLEIQRLDATGGVVVTRGNESARGAAAVYDFNRRVIVMSGGVQLRRGSDSLSGGRLVIDLRTGLSSVDGKAGGTAATPSSSGRVTGSFTVPKN